MTAGWTTEPWLALDTEATGVDPFADRVVEAALVEIQPDGTVGDTYATIVDPGIEIPQAATDVHGITTARARDEGVAPGAALAAVAERIFAHGHRPLVIVNARYDWTLLLCEAERHGIDFPVFAPILDPSLIDRMLDWRRSGSRKLVALAEHYAVELHENDAHGAVADAVAGAHVMRAIVERHPRVGERSLASIYLRQVRGFEARRDEFIDWMRRNRDPDFDEAPGWPIPAIPKRGQGLPILEHPTTPPAEAEPAPAAEKPAPPARPAPAPPTRWITVIDVAKLAYKVFEADREAAPRGQKTKVAERLRHALIWACTDGRTQSLNDLSSSELVSIDRQLRHIREGHIAYAHDDQGVTFSKTGGTPQERYVAWSQIEEIPAA